MIVVHQDLFGLLRDGDAPCQRASGRKRHLHGKVAFVERRNELRAQSREEQQAAGKGCNRNAHGAPAEAQTEGQTPLVDAVQTDEETVGEGRFGVDAALEEQRGHHRYVGQREEEGPDDAEHECLGHRREVFSLDAGQRENREEDDQDDDHGEGCRTHHVAGASDDLFVHLLVGELPSEVLAAVQVGENTLDDHDRAVHDDAEVDGAETHQVGRDPEYAHEDEGKEHRERDDRRHDQTRADVAQEDDQYDEDDDRTLDQIADHGRYVAVYELRAVQVGTDGDPFGQHLLDLCHAALQLPGYHVGVCPLEHHGDAAHAFALAVARHGAEAFCRAEFHRSDVAHVDRYAAAVGHDDVPDVVERRDHAFGADVVGAVHLFDVAAAGVLVVAAQRLEDVADGDVERIERIGIDRHLVLFEVAAEAVDLDDSRDARQLALDDPVLDRTQFHGVIPLFVTRGNVERVLVDLAQSRGDGHHFGGSQLGRDLSGHGLDLFVDQLPCIEYGNALLEDDRNDRQSETGYGADLLDVHDVAHRHLDGEGDELFDLLGGERRRYGDDLYLVVGDIRYGVHRKSQHRIDSSCQQEERGQSDEEFFRYRKADYVLKHGVVKVDFSQQNYVLPDRIAEKICRSALFSG